MKIPFLPGFTAITGPNGSGKSNIADAILFVLGPRSPRAIRAKNMLDLIWNGGKAGKAAKSCKVSLIFDNRDRLMPVSSDEVRLTRVVKVSASDKTKSNSYFYVNGKPSQLREFENLLSYARISADGYNIVQQGDVNRIVAMSNMERRKILDDISGITKFDSEIDRANKQRAEVLNNLEKIDLILGEIDTRMKELKAERANALKFNEIKEKLESARVQRAFKRKQILEAELASFNEQLVKQQQEQQKVRERLEALRTQQDETLASIRELEDKVAEMGGGKAREIKDKIDHHRLESHRAMDAQDTAQESIATLNAEKAALTNELEKVQTSITTLKEERDGKKKASDETARLLKEARDELSATNKMVSNSSSESARIQKEIAALTRAIDESDTRFHELGLEQDRMAERVQQQRASMDEKKALLETAMLELEEAETFLSDIKAKSGGRKGPDTSTEALQREFHAKRNQEKKLLAQENDLEDAIKRLNREYSTIQADMEARERVRKGYNRAVEAMMECRDRGTIRGIHGPIAELGEVDSEYETAMMVAAGSRMQSVVVEDDQVAHQCVDYIKKNKLGRVTFLPLNKMVPGRPRGKALMAVEDPDAKGFASDLVLFDDKYSAAFWYVFGDTVVVKDLTAARRLMGGVRIVTKHGEIIEASGAITGGNLDRGRSLKFGQSAESDLDSLGEKLQNTIAHRDEISETLRQIREDLMNLEDRIRETRSVEETSTSKLRELESARSEAKAKKSVLEKELEGLNENLAREEEARTKLKEELETLAGEVERSKEDRESKHRLLLEATPEKLANRVQELQTQVAELTNTLSSQKSEVNTVGSEITLHQERADEFKERMKAGDEQVKVHKEKIKEEKARQQEHEKELKALLKIDESFSREYQNIQETLRKLEGKKVSNDAAMEKCRDTIHMKEELRIKLNGSVSQHQALIEEADGELERYKDVEVPQRLPPLDELERTISHCERRMDEMQPVNMRAIDKYEEEKIRKEDLKQDVTRLEAQKKDLEKMVDELKTKKTDGLMKVFTSVNENFKEIYKEISNGGEAELIMENLEDPFAGGLHINARPPGKKVLRVDALSGGEKGITSMALIFAIQQFEPSPFYLLDEIDQNLDAVNAQNIAKMVKKNSNSAQFVMISLRRISLREAAHVYGVTIHKNGVTDMVANVNIDKIDLGGADDKKEEAPYNDKQSKSGSPGREEGK